MALSLLLSYFAAETSRAQIEQDQGNAFVRHAKSALDVLDRGMFERVREIQNVALLDEVRDAQIPLERKRDLLERLQSTFNAYAWVGICDPQGMGVVGTGKYLEGKDLSKRPWCTEGRDKYYVGDMHDALLLSKLLPNPSGEMFYLLDVAAPIVDKSGTFQGVLCGHIFWKWAEEVLDSKALPGKDVFLVAKDGLVLSGPEPQRSDLAKLAPRTMQAVQQPGKGSGYLVEQWSNGKTYLVGYAKSSGYREYLGLGWTALVREDVTAAFAPVRELRDRILLGGAALGAFFAWLGWLMAGRISRPIYNISQAADRIAGGDLKFDMLVQAGDGEVARLSAAIHAMVAKLISEIEQRRQAELGLRLSAKVFENNTEAIMITDAHHNVVSVNKAFVEITGYSQDDVLGKNPRFLASGKQSALFYQAFYDALQTTDQWRGEIWNKRKNGEIFAEWVTISALRDDSGVVSHYVAVYLDLTEHKNEVARTQYLANYDVLTTLPNRYLLSDRLEQMLVLAQRHQGKMAVLFIGLDHFKLVNDSLGHGVGDELLKVAAQRLSACLRDCDTVSRRGGDEFVVLLGELNSEAQAGLIAANIGKSLRAAFVVGENSLSLSASIGISLYPEDGSTSVELLRNADLAMHRAKELGRNQLQFYEPTMNVRAVQRLQLESDLRDALSGDQLEVYYQPKVNLVSGKMVGMEALVRWNHPQCGFMSPQQFIPVAEESGLINEIGDWLLRQTASQQRDWQVMDYQIVPVAVNLSARQLSQKDFIEKLQNLLTEFALSPTCIDLELTESMVMDLSGGNLSVVNRLSEAGFHLSLDDFGTGHSSLSRLKAMPVQSLKIDQSFVRDIASDENDRAIVSATVMLAHALGLTVVAEGVETQEQLDFIRELRCEEYQGYLFSHPLAAHEVVKYLVKNAA